MKKTPLKRVWKKRKERQATGQNEKIIFKKIWDEREHYCEVCKKYIYEPATFCFAHVLSKWLYPQFRTEPENIKLVCSIKCHGELDKMYLREKRREFELFLLQKQNETIIES